MKGNRVNSLLADYIELDLVPTSDMRLVAMHDSRLSIATDVYDFPTFADKRVNKTINN